MERKYYLLFKKDDIVSLYLDSFNKKTGKAEVIAFRSMAEAINSFNPLTINAVLISSMYQPRVIRGIPLEEILEKWLKDTVPAFITFNNSMFGPPIFSLKLNQEIAKELYEAGEPVI